MTERQQARITEQQIEAERGNGGDQTVGQKLRLVEADIERQQRQQHEDQSRGREQQQFGTIRDAADVRCHHAVPNNPVGLTSSTTAAMR